MRIGYPCINRSIGCTANHTFRLASYSKDRLRETIKQNTDCLRKILDFNVNHKLFFFRISSDIVPFASHPICDVSWQEEFKKEFSEIGAFIKKNEIRISMHPDQFTLLNSPDKEVYKRSVAELKYHADVLDAMGLDRTAKIQIHAGGVYGDKKTAMERFADRYDKLPESIKTRLVIENDDRLFSLKDCLHISVVTGIPVLFDSFHHSILNNGESLLSALKFSAATWSEDDGVLMTDYSSQQKGKRQGTHAEHIDLADFRKFIISAEKVRCDIMLEIKDKEKSALKAVEFIDKYLHK